MLQRIKAWWEKLITHFALSGQRGRYLARFNFVDRIFKLVQWLVVIALLTKLLVERKTTLGLFYQSVILALAFVLFIAILRTLKPLFMSINPEVLGMGRGRARQLLIRLVSFVIVVGCMVIFIATFEAILTAYIPEQPPRPPPMQIYPYG